MKTKPSLGIKNPYALDQKQFDAAVQLLKEQNANIGEYWGDYLKEISAFKSGNSVVGTAWQVIVNAAQAEKAPVKAVLPKEGATGWSDTWMISAKAKHPNCAYKWMDWIISPRRTPRSPSTSARPVQRQVLCPDLGEGPLRHVPRGRRAVLEEGPLLDHARPAVPGRPQGHQVRALQQVGPGMDRDQGLSIT